MRPSGRSVHLHRLQEAGLAEPRTSLDYVTIRKEVISDMTTSKGDASKAGKLLASPKTPKAVKSVAASDLAQAKGKTKN